MTAPSRRRFLGLATGVSAAVLGSTAFVDGSRAYTDAGTFSSADGIDLLVEWRSEYNGSVLESRDDEDAIPLRVENVLPGDSGALLMRIQVETDDERPAMVTGWFDNTDADGIPVNDENGRNEPERKAGDTTPDEGELLDELRARVWYDTGPLGVSFLGGCDGNVDVGEAVVEGSLREVAAALRDGLPLPAEGCLAPDEAVCFGIEWWLDSSTGNVIQGDSVDLSLSFTATECDPE